MSQDVVRYDNSIIFERIKLSIAKLQVQPLHVLSMVMEQEVDLP